MPITFSLEQNFPVPPDQVFAALTDLDQAPQWMPNLRAIEKLTEGPFGQGTRFRETRQMFGHDATELYEVSRFDPPRALELMVDARRGSSKRGKYRFSYSFTRNATYGTDMTLAGEISDLGLLGTVLAPLLVRPFKRAIAQDHAALRAFLDRDAYHSLAEI